VVYLKIALGLCAAAFAVHAHAESSLPKGWTLPSASEFNERSCGVSRSPYLVRGDFDNDQMQDIAALAYDKTNVLHLIVVLSSRKGSKNPELLGDLTETSAEGMMLELHRGSGTLYETEALGGGATRKRLKHKGDAFELVYCEKSSVAYCWNGKKMKFDQVWTGD
jgi:hypothetical protein